MSQVVSRSAGQQQNGEGVFGLWRALEEAGASAVLTSEGSQAQLPAATAVAIRSGFPQPVYFVDDVLHYCVSNMPVETSSQARPHMSSASARTWVKAAR